LDGGKNLPDPDSLLINGQKDGAVFTGLPGILFHILWLRNRDSFQFPINLGPSMVIINFGKNKNNFQGRHTSWGCPMLGYQPRLTSGFRGMRWSWLKLKVHTQSWSPTTPLMFMWANPLLFWSHLMAQSLTTPLLHLPVLPGPVFSLPQQLFAMLAPTPSPQSHCLKAHQLMMYNGPWSKLEPSGTVFYLFYKIYLL